MGRRPPGPDPAWDWREAPRRGDTDPITARAALERRVAWRLAHPDEWRAQLAELSYFDPAYTYDEGHVYGYDSTTDPHIATHVHHDILDEDGFVHLRHHRHEDLLIYATRTLVKLLGNRVEWKPEVRFTKDHAEQADMWTRGRKPVTRTEPGLVVLPPALALPEGRWRSDEERTMRLDKGHPVPLLALDIPSPHTPRETDQRMALYAALGIAEYLTVDPGASPHPDAPAVLRLYRRQADGRYAEVGHAYGDAPGQSVYSEVCGTHVRLWQSDLRTPPRFQWRDAVRDRWRDPETDAEHRRREDRIASRAEGEAIGEVRMAIRLLHALLAGAVPRADLDRIAADWQAQGPPADAVDRIAAVQRSPREWQAVLDPEARSDDRHLTEPSIRRRTPAPAAKEDKK